MPEPFVPRPRGSRALGTRLQLWTQEAANAHVRQLGESRGLH